MYNFLSCPNIHFGAFCSALCALLWAVATILFRKSGEYVPPVVLNFFKNVVGFALFIATMFILNVQFFPAGKTAAVWAILLVSGAFGIGIGDSLFFASLNRLGAGRIAIIDCLYSPFVFISSFLLLREPFGASLLIAILLMTAALIIGMPPAKGEGDRAKPKDLGRGIAFGIFSMLAIAVGIVVVKPVLNESDALWATTARLAGGILFLGPQLLLTGNKREAIKCFTPSSAWKVTIPASVIGAYLSMFFWVTGMKHTYTTVAAVINQSSAIMILVFATIFLKEPLTIRKSIAIAIGFAAGVLAIL